MSGIGSINQSTGVQSVSEAGAGSSASAPREAGSLLPDPAHMASNSVVALAILMTRADQQEKSDQTKVENASNVAAAQEDASRVQALRDKASQDDSAGWASGLSDIAAGALAISGAAFTDTKGLDTHDILTGISKAAPGAGSIVAAGYKAGADQDDATAAQAEAASQAEIRRYAAAQTAQQAAADSISKVAQYLDTTLQTEAATRLAATKA